MLAELAIAAALAQRGHDVYHDGAGTARVGDAEVPAAVVPCASCHGVDGRGRPEGGVTPPDLRRASLTKPYAVTIGGRTRGPYDARLLRRAITEGIDSSGGPLNKVMPRYAMPRRDLDALLAYLQILGDEPTPGVTDHAIRVGARLPPGPARAALEQWAARFNADGGVYGRAIELRFDPRDDDVLAVLDCTQAGASVAQQARALARFAAARGTALPVAVAGAASAPAAAEAFADEARANGLRVTDDARTPLAAVLVLGAATPPPDAPLVLAIAAVGGAAVFDTGGVERAVAFPLPPSKGLQQAAAIDAAQTFAAALSEVGVDLTRERFREALAAQQKRAREVWIIRVDADGHLAEPSRALAP